MIMRNALVLTLDIKDHIGDRIVGRDTAVWSISDGGQLLSPLLLETIIFPPKEDIIVLADLRNMLGDSGVKVTLIAFLGLV